MVSIPRVLAALDERSTPARPILTRELAQAACHVQIQPARVQQVCLDAPLLAITLGGLAYLVDGHHRLARAIQEGRRTVNVRLLEEAEHAQVLLSDAQIRAYQRIRQTSPPADLHLESATRLDSPRISPQLWRQLVEAADVPSSQARAFPSLDLTPGCLHPERLLWVFVPPLDTAILAQLTRLAAQAQVGLRICDQDILAPGIP